MKIITVEQASQKTTLSRATIYAYAKLGKFPPSVQVGIRQVGWVEAEIDAWLQERIDSRTCPQAEQIAA